MVSAVLHVFEKPCDYRYTSSGRRFLFREGTIQLRYSAEHRLQHGVRTAVRKRETIPQQCGTIYTGAVWRMERARNRDLPKRTAVHTDDLAGYREYGDWGPAAGDCRNTNNCRSAELLVLRNIEQGLYRVRPEREQCVCSAGHLHVRERRGEYFALR